MNKNYKLTLPILLNLIVSFLFALTAFLNSGLSYVDDIYATADKVHFNPYPVQSVVLFFVVFLISFLAISALNKFQDRFHINYVIIARKAVKKDYILWLVAFLLLICAWSPYILSYFPGGIYPDTATCIGQARSGDYNNQQPLFYTMILKLCIIIAGELNAVMLFSILQVIFMAACFSYIIFKLNLHSINKPVLIGVFLFFAVFNLVPLYVVSLWKDSLFSVTLLMFILLLTENVLLSDKAPTKGQITHILIWMVLTVFLRNNGIYVMILSTIILAIAFRKTLLNTHKFFFIATVCSLIVCYIIQGPVFSKLKLNGPFVENLGVLQQQVAYVQVIGGDMTPEQSEFLSRVCPLDTMAAFYRPLCVDTIKWCSEYDNDFLEANKGEFLKVWAGMIKNNPKLYTDAYLYITLGYWNPFKQSTISYVNPEMWPDLREVDRYWQKDVIKDISGSSIREALTPKTLISSAIFLFLTLTLFVLSVNKKDKSWLAFIPALVTYLTVFLATPLAFALRYVYIVVLTLPIYIILAYIDKKSD